MASPGGCIRRPRHQALHRRRARRLAVRERPHRLPGGATDHRAIGWGWGPIRWHDRRRARIGRRAQRRMGSARRTRPSETRRASAGRSNDVRGSLGEWAVKAATAVSRQHENVTLTGARRAWPRRPRPVQPGNINYLTGGDSENLFDTQACILARDGDPSLVLFDFEPGRFDNSTWSPSRSRTGHSTIRSPPSSTSSGDAVSIEDASASRSGRRGFRPQHFLRLQAALPTAKVEDAFGPVDRARLVKCDDEIALMRQGQPPSSTDERRPNRLCGDRTRRSRRDRRRRRSGRDIPGGQRPGVLGPGGGCRIPGGSGGQRRPSRRRYVRRRPRCPCARRHAWPGPSPRSPPRSSRRRCRERSRRPG